MKMYEVNSRLPRLRMEAVRLVRSGKGVREVARHFGYSPGAISKWVTRAHGLPSNARLIPTRSSRPHRHPHELSPEMVSLILGYREERRQCAEILHHRLTRDGYVVSLASVKRVLKRHGCSRYSPWKKWHTYPPRPLPEAPGILTEIDTVHIKRGVLYVYTFLDVMSRFAHALAVPRITGWESVRFVRAAHDAVPFSIATVQSDHGPEFGRWFTKQMTHLGYAHRHSRVRTPSDNGHLERFNRTLQEECLRRIPCTLRAYRKEIPEYLHYYNRERPHMGLAMQTPYAIVSKCFQGID